ncbi:MAG: squalene--hopene cyclase [Bryobacteraceae bacterium]
MSSSASTQITQAGVISQTVQRAGRELIRQQGDQGFWSAELTADSTLESDYILLQLWMYPPQGSTWNPPTRARIDKAAASIFARQLPDGGFNIYVKGPSEISATVKAYFSLKVAGVAAGDPRMMRARDRVLALGGIQAANSYVKINLSLFGMYPREHVPSVPPEVILLGDFLYQMSSWTRAIVISLALVQAHEPCRPVPDGFHLSELFLDGVSPAFRRDDSFFTWRNTFLRLDRMFKLWEKHGVKSVRSKAIRKAHNWMLERFANSDGLGAIYPPMMYAIMALDVLGYPETHPLRIEAVRQFDALMVDDGRRFFFQPCFSPVWDTGIAAYALAEAGMGREALRRSADWLLSKEVRQRGDWSIKRPNVEPSGWYFEFANEFYPDIDDTAMVLLGLGGAQASDAAEQRQCHERAVKWLLAMQSKDGGWAAFDADNNWEFLSNVPFADHNAMLDPTCPDITGRVMEALAAQGIRHEHPALKRGISFLVRNQEPDGSWYGRWGVAYIYGTCFALRGLQAAGEDDREAHVLRAGEWLRSIQNADGGWGESCASYDNGVFTAAESTPSQTAWALLGLMAGGDSTSSSVRKGIEHLVATQRQDGSWNEDLATGTGFPKVFYLKYHLYRLYFPLLALATYAKVLEATGNQG